MTLAHSMIRICTQYPIAYLDLRCKISFSQMGVYLMCINLWFIWNLVNLDLSLNIKYLCFWNIRFYHAFCVQHSDRMSFSFTSSVLERIEKLFFFWIIRREDYFNIMSFRITHRILNVSKETDTSLKVVILTWEQNVVVEYCRNH